MMVIIYPCYTGSDWAKAWTQVVLLQSPTTQCSPHYTFTVGTQMFLDYSDKLSDMHLY